MRFLKTPLNGAYVIELEKMGDERGFFSRLFCHNEFKNNGLDPKVVQANDSYSQEKGSIRGMHYQLSPKAETKLVRCIRGSLYDVIIDLRSESPTFKQWFGVELNAENRKMLFVPRGFAHGFQTLENDTEAFYLVSEFYAPKFERGIRWNDPEFGIKWPTAPTTISDKDSSHPNFNAKYHLNMELTLQT
ncbi:dTDP-4-dehydrorhamnose 3,5-epimerase [Simkania negevensis]|uniref:dTDP-4-dehydrorhamnose 3,5-epimerase n=1 Tax=Simkania negevensis TaxID=83561 RepID=A0ABS3AQ81_9BACT|nr:dTDP-4-dehydrorhamnose 3,5-epimerase [Simkania negevensis]